MNLYRQEDKNLRRQYETQLKRGAIYVSERMTRKPEKAVAVVQNPFVIFTPAFCASNALNNFFSVKFFF